MKAYFKILALISGLFLFTLPDAKSAGDSSFAWEIQSRVVSTNRSKLGNIEYQPSCGSGPLRFKIYRTLTFESETEVEGWDVNGTWGGYHYSYTRSTLGLNGDDTGDNYYYIIEYVQGETACEMTADYHFETNTWTGETIGYCGNGFQWDAFNICDNQNSLSPTINLQTFDCYDTSVSGYESGYARYTLSDEYTTPMLVGSMADYPSEWTSGNAAGYASFTDLTSSPQIRDFTGAGQKAQVRFKVKAPKDEHFEISYRMYKQYDDGTGTNWVETLTGKGTGDWSYYPSQPLEFAPLYKLGATDGCEDYFGGSQGLEPLCASSGSSECTRCSNTPGGPTVKLGSVSVSVSLGTDSFGEHSGSLSLYGIEPTNTLTTPKELIVSGTLKNLEVIRNGGDLRQVKAAQCFADIVTTSATSFELRFYTASGGFNYGTGLYEPSGPPFSVTTIEQIGSTNHIRVTTSNGTLRIYDYEWSAADNGWTLTSGGGIRKESSFWHEGTLTRTNTIRDTADAIVFQERKQYLNLTNYGRVVSKHIVGTGTTAQTNLWFYYDNESADGTNYGSVKMTVEPGGFWKRYQYDHHNRVTNEVSQFLNAATNAAENLCQVIRSDFTSLDGTNDFETRIELLQGIEISREYTVRYPGITHHIRCVTPGAAWTNANNLVTQTYDTYATVALAGKPHRIIAPDGTMQLYEYSDSVNRVTTVYSGQPNGDFSAVINGTKTVTTTSPSGGVVSRYTYDIALGDSYALDWETSAFDGLGRPTSTSYAGVAATSINYDCCGVESTVDRDGVTTTHIHDALHRDVGTLRNGITISNLLDAAGNVLSTTRVGRDNTTQVLRRANYDTAGRILNETNALGGVTAYAQGFDGSGQTVKTNTYPDGGQRIETYFQDGSIKSVTGSAAFPLYYDYGAYNNGSYTKETKGSASGTEWVKTYADMLGRSWKTEYPDGVASTNFFNLKGQLEKAVDPDGVTRLQTYNGLGQTDLSILDLNRNGVGTDSVDRITRSTNDVVEYAGKAARRSQVYQTADNGTEVLASERLSIPALNTSISISFGLGTTNVTQHNYPDSGQRLVTTTHPDGSQTITLYTNGLPAQVQRTGPSGSPVLFQTDYAHDAHGRQYQAIDLRNGATTSTYNAADQVQTITTPSPDGVAAGLVTTTYYDKSLRATNVIHPDSTSTKSLYFANGLLQKTWGSRIYPVEYLYDYAGRMTNMLTWQNFNETSGAGASGSAATKWRFDGVRGWLTNKLYADNTGPGYTYTPAGRLKSRAWARTVGGQPLATWYTNNNAGELSVVNYSDTTPDVTNSYDRRGRMTNVLSGATSLTKLLDDAGNLLQESYTGGPLNGVTVTNHYDSLLRRDSAGLRVSASLRFNHGYGYGDASRLLTVGDGTNSATYDYLDNSALVEQIVYATNGTTVMTTTKGYDFVNRLTNTVSINNQPSTINSFDYKYNPASQRTSVTNVDGSYWVYGYDPMGQVTSGKKYWSDNTPVAGQQFDYVFDDIGNRQTTTRDGRQATYTPNTLNQYTSRTVPGFVNVLGTATNTATVSLWSKDSTALFTPTTRKGDYFWGEMPFNNSTGAMWLTITNVAVLSNSASADIVTNIVGSELLAKNLETFTYDLDGNLTGDSLWTNVWNGENRRITIESRSTLPAAAKVKEEWTILADGRWIERIVSTNNGTAYYPSLTNRYVWDNQVLLAVLDHTNGVVVSFLRGIDLSGSLQGAGGVGGVLAVNAGPSAQCGNMTNTAHFACYDGNGNVTALINAATGLESARYERGPFVEKIRETGPMAKLNPIRFSTQYADDVTGETKYLFRDLCDGRWPNRDPIEEVGGLNIYGFIYNDAINKVDVFGLDEAPSDPFIDLLKSLKNVLDNADNLKKCMDPCTAATSLRAYCDCIWGAVNGLSKKSTPQEIAKAVDEVAKCICQASWDADGKCLKKWRVRAKVIFTTPSDKKETE